MGLKHGITGRKLNRTSSHRRALWRTMLTQLVVHEAITTTLPKAKELKPMADRMVTLAKQGNMLARRKAGDKLRTRESIEKLFAVYPSRFADRSGGYTRVTALPRRRGDNAPMARIEFLSEPVELTRARRQFTQQIKKERSLFKQEFLAKELYGAQ